ncbi:MAG: RNA polymerase sigma factor [Oscillospiraceae bacterium]|nr:RNA polymerase sigma factor [Oscillospiraceae bacterium]
MQSPLGISAAAEEYGSMLYRICLVSLGNAADAEDAVQDAFLKYIQKAPAFESGEHEKAWLIRVAVNTCKDIIKHRRPQVDIDTVQQSVPEQESGEVMAALMTLPEKFRTVLVLHCVEGYSVAETAKMINKSPSAVKMRLQKARKLFEEAYGTNGTEGG